MNKLFAGFNHVRAYIDDLLVMTKGSFKEDLKHIDTVIENLETAGLKIYATKSCFAAHELEYLGYWISQDGIQSLAAKLEAINNGQTKKQARSLHFYCYDKLL